MRNLILLFIIIVLTTVTSSATEIDTIWYRTLSAGAQDVDFTPDDKYVIAWTNSIEFWEVQQGVEEFSVPIETVGDYNFNEQYLVIAHYSTPKLLNWQTREVVEGFEKMPTKLDRIKTAKSKNEFMAKLDQDSNTIYFWDINSKQIIDQLQLDQSFEKGVYKWKRTLDEYGYVGNNDELIYAIIYDENDKYQQIHPSERKKHFFVHFYNRETKELVDSVYSFTNTNEQFGGFNKMQVMNDRSKIAWNHRGGEINFYDILNKRFYDKLVFDEANYVPANNIALDKNNTTICIVNRVTAFLRIFDLSSKTLLHSYERSSFQNATFSNNDDLLVTNIGSWLILFPSHITTSSVNNHEVDTYNLIVTPNPSSEFMDIIFSSNYFQNFRLSIIDLVGSEVSLIDDGMVNTLNYQTNFNVSVLPSGTYFIRLEIGNDIITKQFIKE